MYVTRYTTVALRAMSKMPVNVRRVVQDKIARVAANPRARIPNAKALSGSKGFFRLRIGDWRVVYHVDHAAQIVSIVKVGPRGSVYDD